MGIGLRIILLSTCLTATAFAAPALVAKGGRAGAKVRLDFEGTRLVEAVKRMTELTGKNFILQDQLRDHRVTVLTGSPVSVDEAYQAFLDALEIEGLAVETKGRFVHIKSGRRRPSLRSRTVDCPGLDGIEEKGERVWVISRKALDAWLGNVVCLTRQARIIPSIKDGKPRGFKLYGIRKASLWATLGLKNGDEILRVAGLPMTKPDEALAIYQKIKTAAEAEPVEVVLVRRGHTLTHTYRVH